MGFDIPLCRGFRGTRYIRPDSFSRAYAWKIVQTDSGSAFTKRLGHTQKPRPYCSGRAPNSMEYGCLLWIGSFLPILFRPLSNEVNFSDFVIHHWQTYKKKWKKSIILLTIDLGCDIIIKRSRCRSGGIGRRPGLKIPWDLSRIGSSPISGTTLFMPAATYILYRGVEQLVARRAHNPEAGGSSPPPATSREVSIRGPRSGLFSLYFVGIQTMFFHSVVRIICKV